MKTVTSGKHITEDDVVLWGIIMDKPIYKNGVPTITSHIISYLKREIGTMYRYDNNEHDKIFKSLRKLYRLKK